MAIFLPGRFLHVGTPRCASTATHEALKTIPGVKVFNQHMDIAEMRKYHHGPYRGEFAFATVRNPYDLAVTWYLRSKFKGTFVEFLRDYKHRLMERDGRLFWATIGCHEIMRYETLQEDFDAILEHLGISQRRLPTMNPTDGKESWRSYYDQEALDLANQRFGNEIEQFGYERLEDAWPS